MPEVVQSMEQLFFRVASPFRAASFGELRTGNNLRQRVFVFSALLNVTAPFGSAQDRKAATDKANSRQAKKPRGCPAGGGINSAPLPDR